MGYDDNDDDEDVDDDEVDINDLYSNWNVGRKDAMVDNLNKKSYFVTCAFNLIHIKW